MNDRPLDIILRLPSRAVNSISCPLSTVPDASMFCTANTTEIRIRQGARNSGIYLHAVFSGTRTSWKTYLQNKVIKCSAPGAFGQTYEVKRRFESAALRSLTWACCVALNWTLSWSLSVYRRRSACSYDLWAQKLYAKKNVMNVRSLSCNAHKEGKFDTPKNLSSLRNISLEKRAEK